MIVVGDIKGNLRRLAIVIARRARAVDGMLVWVSGSGSVCCAHVRSQEAATILSDAAPLVVGTYGAGARAVDVHENLLYRAKEKL